jgi:farnesyl diphosphate synthase
MHPIILNCRVLKRFFTQLQSFFLVADDVMDGSSTRRGQDCWYKKNAIGLIAVNDSILLETCIYTLLHKHFQAHPNYTGFLDAFIYASVF